MKPLLHTAPGSALVALLLGALLTTTACAYSVAPEVFWFSIQDHDRKVGFGRGEYTKEATNRYAFHYVLVLHLPTSQTGEIGTYRFDESLRPLSFEQKTLFTTTHQSVTNTAEGDFNWDKGMLSYHSVEFEQDNKQDIPLPQGAVSLFTSNVALAHTPLQVGKKFDFIVFSAQKKAPTGLAQPGFITQHFTITEQDRTTGQFKFVMQADDQPGQDRTFWFLPPTRKHPNGYTTLTTFASQDHLFRLQAATRENAVQGFEAVAQSMGL